MAAGSGSLRPRADFAFCNQGELASLDPARVSGTAEARVLSALFEGLVRLDPASGEPLPGMARSWEVSADALRWTFHLRHDSTWTNGRPVTAEDFRWSFLRLLDPATAAPYANVLWCVRGASDFTHARQRGEPPDPARVAIAAPAPDRLVLDLAAPTPYLPRLLALPACLPVPREVVERCGAAWVRPENFAGNGPFRLVERRVRDVTRLARWDGYWGRDEVALGTIDAYAAEGVTTQLNMYLTGLVDWMVKPPPGLYAELLPRPDALVGTQAGTTFLRFNTTRAPFDDPRVRRALLLALDREALARDVLRGGERGADALVSPGLPGYPPRGPTAGPAAGAGLPPRLPAPDPAAARALLAEAGFPGGRGFPSFELLFPHNEVARDLCEAIAAAWREQLGLQPRLANQAFKVFLDSCQQLAYDTAWSAWTADYLDPSSFLDCFLSGSRNNRTGWSDPGYDALVGRAADCADPGERLALLAQAEARLLEALPVGPLCTRANVNLVAPRVRGFHDNPLDVHPLRDLAVSGPGAP